MRQSAPLLAATLAISTIFTANASFFRLDLDSNNRDTDLPIERVFTGNNPMVDVFLW